MHSGKVCLQCSLSVSFLKSHFAQIGRGREGPELGILILRRVCTQCFSVPDFPGVTKLPIRESEYFSLQGAPCDWQGAGKEGKGGVGSVQTATPAPGSSPARTSYVHRAPSAQSPDWAGRRVRRPARGPEQEGSGSLFFRKKEIGNKGERESEEKA